MGLLEGDGYIGERHIEIYNSEMSILKESVNVLEKFGINRNEIILDIYSEKPTKEMLEKWSLILSLPKEKIRLRINTSPWKTRTEKIRIKVCSKEFTANLKMYKIKDVRSYLKGLFDAEASVDVKGYIEFKQKATKKGIEIVNRTWRLIHKLDIKSTKPRFKKDEKKTDFYFYVKDIKKYKNFIDFVNKGKSEKLRILIEAQESNKPITKEEYEKIGNKEIWNLIKTLKCPYYKIRYFQQTHASQPDKQRAS